MNRGAAGVVIQAIVKEGKGSELSLPVKVHIPVIFWEDFCSTPWIHNKSVRTAKVIYIR